MTTRDVCGLIGAVALLGAPVGAAPQDPEAPPAVEVELLRGSVHLIRVDRGDGGTMNMVASVGADGTLLVDHDGDWRTLRVAEPIVSAIRGALTGIGGAPRWLVNTHWHGDHTSGNTVYGAAIVVAHENVRRRLSERQTPWWFPDGIGPMAASGWPDLTFHDSLSIYANGEQVHLWHFGPAHTDGDAVVYFAHARVAHLGDLYHGLAGLSVGEDMVGLHSTLAAVVERVAPDTRVVTGHSGVTSVEELAAYRDLLGASIAYIRSAVAEGAEGEAVVQRGLPPRWRDRAFPEEGVRQWIDAIYRSLVAR